MLIIAIILIVIFWYQLSERINSELSWISKALMDTKEHKNMKEQAQFYDFIQWAITEGIIRKGMTKEEMSNAIDKHIKDNKSAFPALKKEYEWLECRKNLWFGRNEENYKVIITGYGGNIPTPKLILTIRSSRLISWKGLNEEAEAKAREIEKDLMSHNSEH